MHIDLKHITDQVTLAAIKAGDFIQKQSVIFEQTQVEYKGVNDLVSYVDKTAEQQLVRNLSKILPLAGFTTEEKTISRRVERCQKHIGPGNQSPVMYHEITDVKPFQVRNKEINCIDNASQWFGPLNCNFAKMASEQKYPNNKNQANGCI